MLRPRWTIKALIDFDEAQAYIGHENAVAARRVAECIHEAVQQLCEHPDIGSPVRVQDARTWVVRRTPYLIVYRVRGDTLEIVRVWHGRRDGPTVGH